MNLSISVSIFSIAIIFAGGGSLVSEAKSLPQSVQFVPEVSVSFDEDGNFHVTHEAYIPESKRLSKSDVQSKIKEHRAIFSVKKLASKDSYGNPKADKVFFDNSMKQLVKVISEYTNKTSTSFQIKPTGKRIFSEEYSELQGYMFCASYLHEQTEVSCAGFTILASDLETIASRLEKAGIAYGIETKS